MTGEALAQPRQGAEPSRAGTIQENSAPLNQIMEEVCRPENLKEALYRVKVNKGGAGVNGMTVEQKEMD